MRDSISVAFAMPSTLLTAGALTQVSRCSRPMILRTLLARSCTVYGLTRYSDAPDEIAMRTRSRSVSAVTSMNGRRDSAGSLRTQRKSPMPLMPGMFQSEMTADTGVVRKVRIASCPLVAWITCANPMSRKAADRACRIGNWSSTTRMGSCCFMS